MKGNSVKHNYLYFSEILILKHLKSWCWFAVTCGSRSNTSKIRYTGHVVLIERRGTRKPEHTRPLENPMLIREDNIKVNIKYIEMEGIHWIHLTRNSVQRRSLENKGMEMNFPVSWSMGNFFYCLSSCWFFLRRTLLRRISSSKITFQILVAVQEKIKVSFNSKNFKTICMCMKHRSQYIKTPNTV
jgi:hypothetical protein